MSFFLVLAIFSGASFWIGFGEGRADHCVRSHTIHGGQTMTFRTEAR